MTRRRSRQKPLATGPKGAIPVGEVIQKFANRTAMAIEALERMEDEMRAWRLLATYAALTHGGVIQMTMDEAAELEEAVNGEDATIGADLFLGDEDHPTVLRVKRK